MIIDGQELSPLQHNMLRVIVETIRRHYHAHGKAPADVFASPDLMGHFHTDRFDLNGVKILLADSLKGITAVSLKS